MANLLSDFGSNSSKPAITKSTPKPAMVNKPRQKTFTAPRARMNDELFVKQEPTHTELPSFDQDQSEESKMEEVEDGGDVEGYGDFDEYGDFDDSMFDEELLKKEVANLSIKETAKPTFTTVNKNLPRPDLQNWETAAADMKTESEDVFAQDSVRIENQNLDIFESNGHLNMWWYDAYERKEKGYVYVFGKVLNKATKKYISCCVTVKNIERNLFVLPRKYELDDKGVETETEVEMAEVYNEISELCSKYRISKFASKQVSRKYAFELHDVPAESNYLKVLYDYEQPAFSGEESGKTFSRVFGATTGPLEHFLIKRDIMGPCWLDISNAKISTTSVSENTQLIEMNVKSHKFIIGNME